MNQSNRQAIEMIYLDTGNCRALSSGRREATGVGGINGRWSGNPWVELPGDGLDALAQSTSSGLGARRIVGGPVAIPTD
jgi:hypothetical protein